MLETMKLPYSGTCINVVALSPIKKFSLKLPPKIVASIIYSYNYSIIK